VALARNATPAAKVSAVLAVSGGMVASFAIPATAEPLATPPEAPNATVSAAESVALAAPSAGVAVTAPAFGKIGFTAVVKKKPKLPRVDLLSRAADRVIAPRATVSRQTSSRAPSRASRSATRTKVSSSSRSVAPASSGVLAIAASLTGIYYIYGGSTPAGFDCSGFTSYVFRQVGIYLPRTAAQQQAYVTRVSTPRPGDLVFFGSPAHHMGIYAGNGMMYDSPHTGAKTSLRSIYTSNVTYGRP